MYSQNDGRSLTARTIDYLMTGEAQSREEIATDQITLEILLQEYSAQSREETAQNYKVTLNVTIETTPPRHPKLVAGERQEDILAKDRLYAQTPAPPRKICFVGNFVSQ